MGIFSDSNKHEQLRFNNELKKIRLSVEYGVEFPFENEGLPPEVERHWLDRFLELEEAFSKRRTITVYEKIGFPVYRKEEEIHDDELAEELKRLLGILKRNGIRVGTRGKVEDRKLYYFITRDLFKEEIDDIPVRGLITHFFYEDFYPDDEVDVCEACKEAVHMIFDKENDFYLDFFFVSDTVEVNGKQIAATELFEKMTRFRERHERFEVTHFKITGIDIKNDCATVRFYISYLGLLNDGCGKRLYFGGGRFRLIKESESWIFSKLNLPGLK